MRKMFFAVVFVAGLLFSGCAPKRTAPAGEFYFARDGRPAAQIVVAEKAPPAVRHAAGELQKFLKEMTGALLPIREDSTPGAKHEILLGPSRRLAGWKIPGDGKALGAEDYILQTSGPHLIITGGEPRGTLYGVYGLLEDHLGCRWFTPAVSRIPKSATLRIGPLEERVSPRLEYREPFTMDCFDGDWAARNRMNGNAASLEERHGGKITYFGFVHTFESLLPPEKHFSSHPEFYSLVKGRRLRDRSQLCCTNQEVIRLVTEEVKRRIREHPEAKVFSVSQNDWFNYCECPECTALAEREGSQSAPVLQLVNRVARAVKDEFPEAWIDTLAYQYTRKPPRTLRPEPNVIVRLCSIECCFAHSFESCGSEENRAFVRDVEGWSQISRRLWVWDYVTSFSHYLVPFPNLRVRGANIRFLARHNVRGIFEQDVYNTLNGELSALSGYLNAKLLWNPDYDEARATREFLEAVYGAASAPIAEYLRLIHDNVEKEKIHMDIWVGPEHSHLDDGLIDQANRLWDQAEREAAGNPQVLERVRTARLSVDYATIERMRARRETVYSIDHRNFRVRLDPAFQARVQRFFESAERSGVTQIREANGSLALYKKEFGTISPEGLFPPLPAASPASVAPELRYSWYSGSFDKIPEFAGLTPGAQGTTGAVSLQVANPAVESYALRFQGYLEVPRDGIYTFSLASNDGSRLTIHDQVIIDNDGSHKLMARSGMVGLRAGRHPIVVDYFQMGGAQGLELQYAGPDLPRQVIPASAFWH